MNKKWFIGLFVFMGVAMVANAQTETKVCTKVCQTSSVEKAFTFDLSNTDWFNESGTNITTVGLSLYNLDTVGTFDTFMRVNTTFNELEDMFQASETYGASYGATMRFGQGLYGYGGRSKSKPIWPTPRPRKPKPHVC